MEKKKKIYPAYVTKHNLNREKHAILQHYLAVKKYY